MPRRASSGMHPGIIAGIAAAAIVVFFGGKAILGKRSESIGGAGKLRIEDVMENANSLRGNEYVVEGKIDEKLRWTADHGQVVSLQIDNGASKDFIGVEIPAKFNYLNIEREQKYSMKIKFRQGGIPVATDIKHL